VVALLLWCRAASLNLSGVEFPQFVLGMVGLEVGVLLLYNMGE